MRYKSHFIADCAADRPFPSQQERLLLAWMWSVASAGIVPLQNQTSWLFLLHMLFSLTISHKKKKQIYNKKAPSEAYVAFNNCFTPAKAPPHMTKDVVMSLQLHCSHFFQVEGQILTKSPLFSQHQNNWSHNQTVSHYCWPKQFWLHFGFMGNLFKTKSINKNY